MLDTLSYSESLINIGVPEDQAKLQARVLSEALESNDLATTADIVRLESKIDNLDAKLSGQIVNLDARFSGQITVVKSDINSLRVDLNAQMTAMEMRIIKWQIGGIGLVIAAIKFL